MNQELENYIKQERGVGTSDEAIKQKLRDNGWKDEVFKSYFNNDLEQCLNERSQQLSKNKVLIFMIIGSVVVFGLYFLVKSLNQSSLDIISEKITSVYIDKKVGLDTTRLGLGNETITVIPGRSKIILADDESQITFNSGGTETAVPDIVFGDRKILNDLNNINYLSIKKEVSFYNEGYFFKLSNLGCNTETRFTDVKEIWVTDCLINIVTREQDAPKKQIKQFSQEFNANTTIIKNINNEGDPLIQVSIPKISMMIWSRDILEDEVGIEVGKMTSYSTDKSWIISVVTAFGINTIRYTGEDIYDKKTKSIPIGPLTVESKIKSYNCRVVYRGDDGLITNQCDDIVIEFSFIDNKNSDNTIFIKSYSLLIGDSSASEPTNDTLFLKAITLNDKQSCYSIEGSDKEFCVNIFEDNCELYSYPNLEICKHYKAILDKKITPSDIIEHCNLKENFSDGLAQVECFERFAKFTNNVDLCYEICKYPLDNANCRAVCVDENNEEIACKEQYIEKCIASTL